VTEAIIDLAAAHLKRQFVFQTQRNRFGSVDGLRELAISARGCIKPSLGSGRVTVAFRKLPISDSACARRCTAPSSS
jgi:hypothetical protein